MGSARASLLPKKEALNENYNTVTEISKAPKIRARLFRPLPAARRQFGGGLSGGGDMKRLFKMKIHCMYCKVHYATEPSYTPGNSYGGCCESCGKEQKLNFKKLLAAWKAGKGQ
jgi:hypothetical protein